MAPVVKGKRDYNVSLRQEQAQMTRNRIIDAARRLLLAGTYSAVTMDEIAKEAGVAYQTVYAIFGTKIRLAEAMVDSGFSHLAEALNLLQASRGSADPEIWLRTVARVWRAIYEPCADLLRFTLESGDPALQEHYRQVQESRLGRLKEVVGVLERSGRLRSGLTTKDALDVMWAMTSPDTYTKFVFQRRWQPDRFEEWLASALVDLLLERR
jgi:TetR/AcrR family transcriptional regulator, regulator of autoinduction and epiphytic fitness